MNKNCEFWEKIDKIIGEKFPDCLKILLSSTGYDNGISLKYIDDEKLNELENFISNHRRNVLNTITCCYTAETNFTFLPGQRSLILALADLLKSKPPNAAQNIDEEIFDGNDLMSLLVKTAKANFAKSNNRQKYDRDLFLFSVYSFLVGGNSCYQTLQANLPMPSVSSIYKHIGKNKTTIVEGEIRADELNTYLESKNVDKKIVWLCEDATGEKFKNVIL